MSSTEYEMSHMFSTELSRYPCDLCWLMSLTLVSDDWNEVRYHRGNFVMYTPFLWYRGFYDTAVFILCSYALQRHPPFFYLYIHKHNSHIYRNVWSFCPNVLNFCKYTYFYLFLRIVGHFYFALIPCFVKYPIINP